MSEIRSEAWTRRDFLKTTGAAALGVGLTGCVGRKATEGTDLRVRTDVAHDSLAVRAGSILEARIRERCPGSRVAAGTRPGVVLAVDRRLPREGFRLSDAGADVRITGGSPQGLLYGIGKFLRTSQYGADFQPSAWRGTSAPEGSLRGMYFATHFHNWYHVAPEDEVVRYLEDLALWGINAVMVIFPMINLRDWDDPEAGPAMAMVRRYAQAARSVGMRFATGLNNTMFSGAPEGIRATRLPDPTGRRGNSGHPICPSLPDGHAYLVANARRLFEQLADVGLDLLVHWPYDEGGCACERCRPWGSNGYLRFSRDVTRIGREYFPKLQSVLSTWMFDTPPEGEWAGLTDALAKENGWVDYILADAHEDFPRYPLDVTVPGGLPLVTFPEISMWGNWPWGGMGANPLPGRFQRLWDQVRSKAKGGFPYSEGIYEDLNKAVVAQFYWESGRLAQTTLTEYVAYEFGPGVTGECLALFEALEDTASRRYRRQPVDTSTVARARQVAESVEARLPEWGRRSWRWELVQLRAVLDYERHVGGGLETPAAEAALMRLIEIYHCQLVTDDPYHHRVRPPLKRAVSRRGQV